MVSFTSSLGPCARHAKLEEYALQAFVTLVVHLIGMGVLVACYYNLYVLDDYVLALFWAVVCSIPVFQIKMRVIHAMLRMLDWWWSVEYVVLGATEDGKLRLRSEGEGLREDLSLLPEVLPAAELQQRLGCGEELRAVVQCRRPPETDRVVSIVQRGHWLGTLRPYESIWDLLGRDLPVLWCLAALQLSWMVSPLRRFHRGEAGSKPYFGLVIRLCVLHWTARFLGAPFVVPLLGLAVHLYILVVLVRLGFTLLAHLAPHVLRAAERGLKRLPCELLEVCTAVLQHGKAIVCWCCWAARKRSSSVIHAWLATFLENSHFILSIVIILVCLLVACKALSLLCLSLQHEAFVIWRTLHGLLQPSPVYQVAMTKLSHLIQAAGDAHAKAAEEGSAAGLWNFGQSLLETTVPAHQEFLQHNVPDFHILKYIFYDIWTVDDGLQGNASLEALASLVGGLGAVDSFGGTAGVPDAGGEEEDVCAEAVALGASCVRAEQPVRSKPLQQQLQNTTALLRMLADGNASSAFGLLQDAYAEVAAASSLLSEERGTIIMLDGALHGSTWLARLTMHCSIVLMHLLTMASSMLGQAIVFLTALFYLLASRVSCLEVVGEFLMVIDRSKVIFRISELVVRAVLLSALKMSAFHALFTWLLYSWGRVPVVVVPTVLSALVALVPVVSPVWSVSIWAAVYLWVQDEKASAALALVLNLGVWWQVPSVIYAEIPESNPWLTGLSVVLGIGHFGVAGVVLGPMVASVPLICFNLVKLFNGEHLAAPSPPRAATPRRKTLLTLYQSESFLKTDPGGSGSPSRSAGRQRRLRQRLSPRPEELDELAQEEPAEEEKSSSAVELVRRTSKGHGKGHSDPDSRCPKQQLRDGHGSGHEQSSEEAVPFRDLITQKKHREISERVLSSPNGPLLKQLCAREMGSPLGQHSADGEGFFAGARRVAHSGSSAASRSSRSERVGAASPPSSPSMSPQ